MGIPQAQKQVVYLAFRLTTQALVLTAFPLAVLRKVLSFYLDRAYGPGHSRWPGWFTFVSNGMVMLVWLAMCVSAAYAFRRLGRDAWRGGLLAWKYCMLWVGSALLITVPFLAFNDFVHRPFRYLMMLLIFGNAIGLPFLLGSLIASVIRPPAAYR